MNGLFRVSNTIFENTTEPFTCLMTLEELTDFLRTKASAPHNPDTPQDGYEFYQQEELTFSVHIEYIPFKAKP